MKYHSILLLSLIWILRPNGGEIKVTGLKACNQNTKLYSEVDFEFLDAEKSGFESNELIKILT